MSSKARPSILIVLMGSVGDVARGLPLVHAIKAAWPGCRVSWLVEPKSFGVVALHNGIDEVIRFERGAGLAAVWKLRKTLRARRFDLVLDLQRHFKSGVFSWLTGAPRRIGFHRNDTKEGNWLFSTETISARGEEVAKLVHYLTFLSHLGIPQPEPLEFGIRERATQVSLPAELEVLQGPLVGLVLGSSWRSKDWFAEGYSQLISALLSRTKAQVVLLGDGSMAALSQKLSAAHPSERVVTAVGKTSLQQLVAVIARTAVMCGPDSGPGHLAAALNVPYVGLFGATNPGRTAPYRSEGVVVQSNLGCAPCYRRECPGLGRLCMRLISPEVVCDRICSVLG
jgi:lipopolysaccharide heptosyltransferase I